MLTTKLSIINFKLTNVPDYLYIAIPVVIVIIIVPCSLFPVPCSLFPTPCSLCYSQ
ncbi:hypothetical protein BJP36_40680 [Moorena producens JHB]|uniref:Uncharacterized protein n=1 Tax=Moorena producens (strain JHB) TaxID=1454205 RepID=A0A9Q9SS78_MOOP1|nr:hypothetical protein [Moorena producens]WAN68685.1 hypothetical protein BJP36_40680 [Moorena producens JHB]